MPRFTLIHPKETAAYEDVVAVVRDYDSEIKILDGGIGSVDVEMTEQQHDDFLMINGNWASKPIANTAYLTPSIGGHVDYENLRGNLGLGKNQPN